jgi:hypothetical protein
MNQAAEEPMLEIAGLLADSRRSWATGPPGDEAAIRSLQRSTPVELPSEYLDLLRHSDGGEGSLALPPLYFMLYSAEFAAELNASDQHLDLFPGYFVFGSNGGPESIAFDVRDGRPWPIVMYDPVAGVESAVVIAEDMASFVPAIGLEAPECSG